MATPPVLAASGSTVYNDSVSPKTATVAPANGDTFVVVVSSEDQTTTVGAPTGGGWTYTLQQSIVVSQYPTVYIYTFRPTNSTGFDISVSDAGGAGWWGFTWYRFTGTDGVGASTSTNVASGAPSLAVTTSFANSALVCISSDWVPVDGATRTWRTVNSITPTAGNGGEKNYFFNATHYTTYSAFWSDAGAAGAKTVGLSAPGAQKYAIAVVEVQGTTTAAPSYIPPATPRRRFSIAIRRARAVTTAQPGLPIPPALRSFKASRRPWRGLRPARARVIITPQPGPPAPPTYQPPNPSDPRFRFLPTRRGRSTQTPPPVAPPVVVSYIPPNPSRRPRFFLGTADRARTTTASTPTTAAYVVPVQPRRRIGVLARRGRQTVTPPAPVVVTTVPYVAPIQPRRRLGLSFLDRGGRQTVTPPAAPAVTAAPYVAPTQARRSPQLRIFRGRTTPTPPASPALPPPTYVAPSPTRRPWRGLGVARARATVTPQPGLPAPPTWLPPTARQPRLWRGLQWLRGRGVATPSAPTSPATGPYAMATLSQDAAVLNLEWISGDPISLAITVQAANWSGTYRAQIRAQAAATATLLGELTVVATFSAPDTAITMTMTAVLSALIPPGAYYWDLQQTGGPTRLRGTVSVRGEVTV